MTTPTNDGVPYGVVLEPIVNSALFRAVKSHPKLNGFNLNLVPGPCQVSYTWDGEQSCAIVLRRNGNLRELDAFPQKTGGGYGLSAHSSSEQSPGISFISIFGRIMSTLASIRQGRWKLFQSSSFSSGGGLDDRTGADDGYQGIYVEADWDRIGLHGQNRYERELRALAGGSEYRPGELDGRQRTLLQLQEPEQPSNVAGSIFAGVRRNAHATRGHATTAGTSRIKRRSATCDRELSNEMGRRPRDLRRNRDQSAVGLGKALEVVA